MWNEVFDAKVIRAEGFEKGSLKLVVLVDDREVVHAQSWDGEKSFGIPQKSTCRIVLHDLNGLFKGSVKFTTEIILDDGVQWLPLFDNPEKENVEICPDDVQCPRVLVMFRKKIILDPINEGGDKSEVASACDEDYMPEIKLCTSFNDHYCDSQTEENFEEISQTESFSNFSSRDPSPNEYQENLKKLMILLEIEKKSSETLKKELEIVKKTFEDELKLSKSRETGLLDEFKNAENQLSDYRIQLLKTRTELSSVQGENTRLIQLFKASEWKTQQKLEELQKKLEIHEKSSKFIQNFSKPLETSQKNPEGKDETIKKLQSEINLLRGKIIELTLKIQSTDELEDAVQRSTRGTRLAGLIKRDKEQSYTCNNKKISLMIKDGQLLCRAGSIFKPFSDFLKDFLLAEAGVVKIVRPSEYREAEDRSPLRKSSKQVSSGSKSALRGSIIKKD